VLSTLTPVEALLAAPPLTVAKLPEPGRSAAGLRR